jgi:hypothetical protein
MVCIHAVVDTQQQQQQQLSSWWGGGSVLLCSWTQLSASASSRPVCFTKCSRYDKHLVKRLILSQ